MPTTPFSDINHLFLISILDKKQDSVCDNGLISENGRKMSLGRTDIKNLVRNKEFITLLQ